MIGPDGAKIGVMTLEKAIDYASASGGLDLVEVSPDSDPPVCKVMDYGKFRYRQSKKGQGVKQKRKTFKIKEIKVTPNTDKHDYEFKLNHARRFLADGLKVKVTVFFRGRQIVYQDAGLALLNRFTEDLKDEAQVEVEPKREDRRLSLLLAPTRKRSE